MSAKRNIVFGSNEGFGSTPRRGIWIELAYLSKRHLYLSLFILMAGIVKHGAVIATAAASSYTVALAVTGAEATVIVRWIWIVGALVVSQGAASWIDTWLSHDLAYRVLFEMRIAMYNALDRLAPAYMIDRRSGDLAAAAIADVDTLERFFAHTLWVIPSATIASVAALVVLATVFHPLPAAIIAVFAALMLTIPRWLGERAREQGKRLRAQLAEVNADVIDGVQGLREVVVFGYSQRQTEKLRTGSDRLISEQLSYGSRRGLEGAATGIAVSLALAGALISGTWLVSTGKIPYLVFPPMIAMAGTMLVPLTEVLSIARDFGIIRAAAARVLDVLHAEPNVDDAGARPLPGKIEPHIKFEDVHFKYNVAGREVLSGVSFEVRPGETVALVGRSGAGKSTCVHLLMRFWDVTSGKITVDGHDVRDMYLEDLRRLVTLVPQDVYLFNMSVGDNIKLGRPDADPVAIAQAAQAAQAGDFIADLPAQYDTPVGERGAQLSGGQRQRIAIARALLKSSPILVMDEAVSNLDTESERALALSLEAVKAKHTTLIVAHRLTTIMSADRIVMLDGGRVVATGTHSELMAMCPEYRRIILAENSRTSGVAACQ